MLSFSAWNLCETLSIWFAGQANIFIVARVLDTYYLGLYRTGMTTINSYMALFTSAITPVLFSSLSRVQNDTDKFMQIFNRFQKLLSLVVIPMGVGIFINRQIAVQILLGSTWEEVTDFMGLWALVSSLTIAFSNMASEVYRSKGMPKISFYIQVAYLAIYIPTIYISAKIGFESLCIVSCMVRLIPVVADLIVLNCLFKISIKNVIDNVSSVFFATGIMTLASWLSHGPTGSVIRQFANIILCILVYTLIILLNKSNRVMVMSFFGRKDR